MGATLALNGLKLKIIIQRSQLLSLEFPRNSSPKPLLKTVFAKNLGYVVTACVRTNLKNPCNDNQIIENNLGHKNTTSLPI